MIFVNRFDLPENERSVTRKITDEKILNYIAYSPALRARPNDWARKLILRGFCFCRRK